MASSQTHFLCILAIDFQESPLSEFIWRKTSRDFVAHGRPLRGLKRLTPLAKRSTCSKSTLATIEGFNDERQTYSNRKSHVKISGTTLLLL